MGSQAQAIRNNREAQMQRDINAMAFPQQDELINGIPASGNDAALAAHLRTQRETNLEYQRLQTEEARQQFESMAADNFRRNQYNAQQLQDQAASETMNQAVKDAQSAQVLFSQLEAATEGVKGKTAYTADLDKLRDYAMVSDQVERLTGINPNVPQQQPQQKQPRPEAFPDGKTYQLNNLPDGNLEIQLITGERFIGDPITVTQKLAEAQVQTKRWGQSQRQQTQTQVQPTEQQTTPQIESTGSLAGDLAARNAMAQADALAKRFGFSNEAELMQWGETINQKIAKIDEYEMQNAATEFFTKCPDFPATEQANEAIGAIVETMHLPLTGEGFQAAHAIAVQRGMYQPISKEALQQAQYGAQPHRATAPPMLRGNNPEMLSSQNPYDMPLSELRKQAINQELNKSGPGYRDSR